MKKFSICSVLLGAMIVCDASGVNLCVRMPQSSSCMIQDVFTTTTWNYICDSGGISGISVCSNTSTSGGSVVNLLKTESTSLYGSSLHCWCKMTAPAVSKWVYITSFSTVDACVYGCAQECKTATSSVHTYFNNIQE